MKRRRLKSARLAFASFLIFNILGSFTTGSAAKAFPKEITKASNSAREERVATRGKQGKFQIVYSPVKTRSRRKLRSAIIRGQFFEALTSDLNNNLILPTDITVKFAECGIPRASYQSYQVVIC